MSRALVVYGTTEGQTAKIAQHIAHVGREAGHEVDVVHGAELPDDLDLESYDRIIVGASVHEGHHQRYIRRFAKEHRDLLERKGAAFFQVSLTSVVHDETHDRQAEEMVAGLTEATGWHPSRVGYFAGALLYTKYSWLKRALMKMIVQKESGDTDTSRDYEYTDWDQVTAFAREVLG